MTTREIPFDGGPVPLRFDDEGDGEGRPYLVLHGGAGPDSVAGLGARLAAETPARVVVPTHPGFAGTPRPDHLNSIAGLAELYQGLLEALELTGVTVVGSSIGGWIAAELALLAPERIRGLVLIDAAGITSAAHPATDFFGLTLDEVIDVSFADPDAHRIDVASFTDEQKAVAAGNRAALLTYGTARMADPGLAARLAGIVVPTLVVWGEADRMLTPGYGREYAAAIPGATFRLLPAAGHLPQLETPDELLAVLHRFG
jgi:pimeloyl-ACP methyl ester carboxylesterase